MLNQEASMSRNIRKRAIGISVILIIVFLFFSADGWIIGSHVKSFSQMAQEHFPGDRVSALISMVDCETCDMYNRDHAVWALGQLGDERAVPVLEKYYAGNNFSLLNQETLKIALRPIRREDIN
jgi:hypothetical protein